MNLRAIGCPVGHFGAGCEQLCSCGKGSRCDPVSGTCLCPLGRTGMHCDRECGEGYYGANCIHPCNCRNNASCDSLTGCCDCSPGWYGQLCDKGNNSLMFLEGSLQHALMSLQIANKNDTLFMTMLNQGHIVILK